MSNDPTIKILTNPFNLRDNESLPVSVGTPLINFIQLKYPKGFKRPARVILNGDILKVEDYDVRLKENDEVQIQIMPLDPVTIAIIAVSAAVISYVVVSNIDLPEIPSISTPDTLSNLKNKNGNAYDTRTQRNLARLNEPIPTQYGKFGWYPDLAIAPYTRYLNNAPIFHYVLSLGKGEHTIQDIKLGSNSILDNLNLDYTLYDPGTAMTKFNDNVYTHPDIESKPFRSSFKNMINETLNFDKSAKTITIPGSPNKDFTKLFQVDDIVLITGTATSLYDGEYTISAVTQYVITVTDSTDFDSTATGIATIIANAATCSLNPYYDPALHNKTTGSYFINSLNSTGFFDVTNTQNEYFTFELDFDFQDGLYAYDTTGVGQDQNIPLHLWVYMIPIDGNGDIDTSDEYLLRKDTPTMSFVSGNTYELAGGFIPWRNDEDLSTVFFPNSPSTTLIFYESAVAIDPSDIASIDYTNGQVTFVTSKAGAITIGNLVYTSENKYGVGSIINLELKGSTTTFSTTLEIDPFSDSTLYRQIKNKYKCMIYKYALVSMIDSEYFDGIVDNGNLKQLKLVFPDVQNYPAMSLLALTFTPDASLNINPDDRLNIVTTRKLHQWSGSSWTGPTATRSIAWALADIWMSTYGASRSDTNLDLATLLTLDTLWTSRGDTFDGVFDSSITIWEALSKVARAGRCRPIFDGANLTFVRDEAQSTYTALFNPDNIIKNSFSIDYSFSDNQSPDGVIVKYLDEDDNYSIAQVQSDTNLSYPKTVDFFGVVNYDQAWRESKYLSAQMLKQRVQVKFSTELAGHIPFIGDLISVQYDLPSWGQGGQVTSKSGTTINTAQELEWTGSAPFYMSFMKPNGALSGPHTVTQGTGNYQAILDTDVTSFTFITTLGNQNPTLYQFGPSTNWNKGCVITKILPKNNNTSVDITCVPYNAAIHTADAGTPPTKPSTLPTGNPIPPKIAGLILTNVPLSGNVVSVWNPQIGITNYKVQKSTDNIVWVDVSTPSIATETISATGNLYVRVACVISSTVGEYVKQVIVAT